jgi:hypothetical protein
MDCRPAQHRPGPRASVFVSETRSGAGVVEDESHDDRIPQLSARPTVVAAQPTLIDESEALVEASSLLIVWPDLEHDLVRVVCLRPLGDRVQERCADAKASVFRGDLHAEVRSSAVQVRVRRTDEPPVVFHYESSRVRIVEIGTPSIGAGRSIERVLRSEPFVFTDDGIDKFEHRRQVIGGCRSHRPKPSLHHERMMLDPALLAQ